MSLQPPPTGTVPPGGGAPGAPLPGAQQADAATGAAPAALHASQVRAAAAAHARASAAASAARCSAIKAMTCVAHGGTSTDAPRFAVASGAADGHAAERCRPRCRPRRRRRARPRRGRGASASAARSRRSERSRPRAHGRARACCQEDSPHGAAQGGADARAADQGAWPRKRSAQPRCTLSSRRCARSRPLASATDSPSARAQVSEQLHESALYRKMVELERKIDAHVERRKARLLRSRCFSALALG